jgi:hypothetical protein
MVSMLYLTSNPVLLKKTAPRIISYLQVSDSNMGFFVVQHSYFCQVQAILNCTLPPLLTIGKNLPIYLPFYSEIFGMVYTFWANISY